jgi:hypothetical protein
MSWLSPKHLDDASRILRGVALVLAKAAIDRWGGNDIQGLSVIM